MPTGVFRLKGSNLLKLGQKRGIDNIHQVSMRGGVSYPTVHRYFENPDQVESVSLRALYGTLIDGLGLTPDELSNMAFGEIFESVPDQVVEAQ